MSELWRLGINIVHLCGGHNKPLVFRIGGITGHGFAFVKCYLAVARFTKFA